jgi:hypothetical protein
MKGEPDMKNKNMLCVLLCVALFLCGCAPAVNLPTTTVKSAATEEPIPTTTTPPRVSITVENGQYLLEFAEGNSAESSGGSSSIGGVQELDIPTFSNLSQMKTAIEQGKFTESQIKAIKTYKKDASGKIKICDLNNLYDATVPDGFGREYIAWNGTSYNMDYVHENGITFMGVDIFDLASYEKSYKEEFSKVSQKYALSTTEPERNAEVYVGTPGKVTYKYVRYTIVDGNKTLNVLEIYYVGVREGVANPEIYTQYICEDVPNNIRIWGEQDGVKFTVGLWYPKERPSMEYLSQFGLTAYVEE